MADIKVRNFDAVASALKERAKAKRISLEEEIRRTLAASVKAERADLVKRARALHAAADSKPGKPEFDSARIIRAECDSGGMSARDMMLGEDHGRHQGA
jgi:plasmid stability protein